LKRRENNIKKVKRTREKKKTFFEQKSIGPELKEKRDRNKGRRQEEIYTKQKMASISYTKSGSEQQRASR